MNVHLTDIVPDPAGSHWVKFYAMAGGGLYYVAAKVFTEGSEYGIDGGRVSMLWVEDHPLPAPSGSYKLRIVHGRLAVDYDRGEWNKLPETPAEKAVVDAVVDMFDNHWDETGLKPTKHGWIVEKQKSGDGAAKRPSCSGELAAAEAGM